ARLHREGEPAAEFDHRVGVHVLLPERLVGVDVLWLPHLRPVPGGWFHGSKYDRHGWEASLVGWRLWTREPSRPSSNRSSGHSRAPCAPGNRPSGSGWNDSEPSTRARARTSWRRSC